MKIIKKSDKFYKRLKLTSYSQTIIVKSVGKAATFYLFFSFLPPPPGPMLSKTLMFVRVTVPLYPNIE